MREIEAKILEINSSLIIKKLLALGAKMSFDGQIAATGFDFADQSLSKNETLIRLRIKGDQVELTYKKLLSTEKAKVSEELEVTVSNFDTMKKILLGLGLRPKYQASTKHRTSYLLDGVHFEFDTYPDLPTFLEIEAPDEQTLQQYAAKLGFSPADLKSWGTQAVFNYYKKSI